MRISRSPDNNTYLSKKHVGIGTLLYILRSISTRRIISTLAICTILHQLLFASEIYDNVYYYYSAVDDPMNRPSPRIGAYYYAWYEDIQWKNWKTKFIPQLGLYYSLDDHVLRNHSIWARQANIEFFVMSWSTQRNHNNVIRYLDHNDTIPIAIHIESHILYFKSRTNTTKQNHGSVYFNESSKNIYTGEIYTFEKALLHYMYKVMDDIVIPYRHKYIFVENRPVFIIYLAREFVHYSDGMMTLRNEFYKRYNVQPYIIADIVGFEHNARVKHDTKEYGIHVWDSITSYNRFEGRKTESLEQYMDRLENEYDTYSKLIHDDNTNNKNGKSNNNNVLPVVPYVQPGYDDTLIRSHEHGKNGPRPTYDRNNGKTYHKFWDLAQRLLEKNPCKGINPNELFIFVCSFNEWHESTSIEPSKEWGNHMLEITKERSTNMKPKCDRKAHRVGH